MRNLALFILLVPAAASAQPADSPPPPASGTTPAPWSVAIEPRVGASIATSKLGPFVIGGLQVDVATPVANHRLLVGLDLSFTRPSHDGTVMDPRLPGGETSYTIKEQELGIALLASYRFADAGASIVPWGGVGPMIHLLESTETTMAAPGDNTAQSTEFGVEAAGGVDLKAGPGYVAGDVRFAYTKLDHTITGNTNAGKIAIALGYRLVF